MRVHPLILVPRPNLFGLQGKKLSDSCCDLLMSTGVWWVWRCIVQGFGYWRLCFFLAWYGFIMLYFVVTFKVTVEICGVAMRAKHTLQCTSHRLSSSGLYLQYFHTAKCKPFLGMRSVLTLTITTWVFIAIHSTLLTADFPLLTHSFQTLNCR